jgi:protoporphyrinogen oxidase
VTSLVVPGVAPGAGPGATTGDTTVVIGAGVSGLGFATWWRARHPGADVVVLEAAIEPGGYCQTVVQDGFVWDYSGHFFHFKDPEIEAWLRARMAGQEVRTVVKRSAIRYAGRDIDFPFQKHIHQLPLDEFLECLVELFAASRRPVDEAAPRSFGEMLYRRLGKGITDKFLRPYNEKLYAIDLDRLDPSAMGRFFPHADLADIIENMRPRPPGALDGGDGAYDGLMNMQRNARNQTTLEPTDNPNPVAGSRFLTEKGYPVAQGSSFLMAMM